MSATTADDEVQIMIRTLVEDSGLAEIQERLKEFEEEIRKVQKEMKKMTSIIDQAKRIHTAYARAMREVQAAAYAATKKIIELGNAVNKTCKAIDNGFRNIIAVTALIGAMFISLASDANEMNNKFNVVFGNLSSEVDKWAGSYGRAINRSKNSIKGMLTENQDLFVGMGMSREAAMNFSKQVVMLTNDLASFNNLDTKRASELMMSSLMGESQAARSLGANILEAQLNVTAMQMGYKKYSDKMDEVTKMTIRYNTILRQNGDAMGDSTRTAWDWANVSRGLIDNLKELAAIITAYVLPSLAETAGSYLEIVYNVKDYVTNNKVLMVSLADVILGFLKMIGTIFLVAQAINILTSPMFFAIAALALLYAAWETNFYGIRDIMQKIMDFVTEHPIISAFLGFTAWAVAPLIINFAFAFVGETLAAMLTAALIGAGLKTGTGLAALGWNGAAEIGAGAMLGGVILGGFMIGVGISILSGGTKDIADYIAKTKQSIVDGIEAWKNDREVFTSALKDVFKLAMKDALNAVFDMSLTFIGIDSNKVKKFFKSLLTFDQKEVVNNNNSAKKILGKQWTGGLSGFDTGGYTGLGGVFEPAGIVHKGEYVIPKWMVNNNPDLIGSLESQRLRGYDSGGGTSGTTRSFSKKSDTSFSRKIANEVISILQKGGKDSEGVDKMTNAINGLAGLFETFTTSLNTSTSELMKSVNSASKDAENYKATAMESLGTSTGTDEDGKKKKGKELFDFAKEQSKFFQEMTGLDITNPSEKYFEEYNQFLKSSLSKVIDENQPQSKIDEISKLFKENSLKLEGAKLESKRLEELKKEAEEFKSLMQKSLETAMSNALATGNLQDFKTSLGNSAYDSLKSNMMKAFSESKIYQDMFAKWFNTDDIKLTGDMEGDFKLIQEKLKEAEDKLKAAGLTVDSKEKERKEKFNNEVNNFSNALSSVASQLNNDFLNALSTSVSGIISFMNALTTFQLGGALNSMTGALGMIGAVVGVVQGISSSLDSKRDAKNDAQLQLYEENTKALEVLGTKLDDMTSQFSTVADSIIKSLASNPTLARTAQSSSTLSNMLNIIDENKSFGQMSFVADYKKDVLIGSDKHRKETFSFGPNIDDYNYDQLKAYREQLNSLNNSSFSAMAQGQNIAWDSSDWGDYLLGNTGGILGSLFGFGDYEFNGIDSSNLEEYKKNLDTYLKAYEEIVQKQKEITRTSTLESFEGIEKLADDDLREQYQKMFEDMGLDPAQYAADIEEMVQANNILITATDDVRSAWITAVAEGQNTGDAMLTSLSSYFSKMVNNIASVLYDTDMSNFDSVATDYFSNFSNALANAKINGSDILSTMKDYLKGSDTQNFINEILNVKEANKNIDEIAKVLREELLKAGLTDEDIDNLGIIDSARQKFLDVIEEVKNALKTAIEKGLETGSLVDFKKSLGDSIYSSAKDALVTAFSESAVYKEMFAKWFEVSNVEFTGNLDTDFATIQSMLDELRAKLRENNMDSTADDGSDTTSSDSSSSYYTGSSSAGTSTGTSVVEYHYHFDFTNANVYNKEEVKELIIDTINDTKKV